MNALQMTKRSLVLALFVLAVLAGRPVLAQMQGTGSGLFGYFIYLPLVTKSAPYPPLCFGEDIDWDGFRQEATSGGNDVVSQGMPVGITYPSTCIGRLHRDDALVVPYPDADFWHLGVPHGAGGYVKVTATGLPDGVVLNWLYCNNAADCADDFEWVQDSSGSGVRSITLPVLPEGGVIGIQPTWDDQFDNDHIYTLTVEALPK